MTGIRTVVFDLDGTLLDTSRDITAAVNHVRKTFGLKPLTVHEVIRYVGLGITHLMEQSVIDGENVPLDEARLMIVGYYANHLLDETVVYPGIQPLLESLNGRFKLAVATNKPFILASKSIKGLGLEKFFNIICGPETVGKGKPDPEMLNHISAKLGSEPSEMLMVGDSPVDIETAQNFGCRSCAVAWGYNVTDILHTAKPDYMIHEPMDLLDCL